MVAEDLQQALATQQGIEAGRLTPARLICAEIDRLAYQMQRRALLAVASFSCSSL